MPRRTHATDVRRTPFPRFAEAARLARKYGPDPRPSQPTRPTPDAAPGAYAVGAAAADARVLCLEEARPGRLVLRWRPIEALGWRP